MACRIPTREFQTQVIGDIAKERARAQLIGGREKVPAKMPAHNSGEEIEQEVSSEQPGEKEMPSSPQSKVAPAWDSHPSRKSTHRFLAIGIARNPKNPCRVKG